MIVRAFMARVGRSIAPKPGRRPLTDADYEAARIVRDDALFDAYAIGRLDVADEVAEAIERMEADA